MIAIFNTLSHIAGHPLNRGATVSALSRFFRWQVASRLIKRPVALPFVNDTGLITETGMRGATGNYYCGLFEPAEMGFVLHILRPGDLFVDVGANAGVFTVIASGAAGAEAIAIEPIPLTFARLQRNIGYNRLDSLVDALNCGASSEPGVLHFTEGLDAMNRVALEGETSIAVPVRTIDSICAGRAPSVLKIDVEGHEVSVLRGAKEVLTNSSVKAVLIETNGSGEKFGNSDDDIFCILEDQGFRAVSYDPLSRTVGDGSRAAKNAIFVRDKELVQHLCAEAPRFRLVNRTI